MPDGWHSRNPAPLNVEAQMFIKSPLSLVFLNLCVFMHVREVPINCVVVVSQIIFHIVCVGHHWSVEATVKQFVER